MEIKTCNFVEVSEVFEGCDRVWDALVESEQDFTWGGNNRSLVTANRLLNAIEEFDKGDCPNEDFNAVVSRLKSLGDTYIDLEN